MIEQLSVKDYVLFKSCIIDFTDGMSVITGETGAGKSLLIDAIGYLSGNPPCPLDCQFQVCRDED